jgi:hypothetical protein
MRVRRHPGNIRRMLASRLKKVAIAKPILIASLAEVERVCGKPTCRCQRGFKHCVTQLTYRHEGKNHAMYVPVDFTEEVRSWIEEHHKLQRLLREISELSLMLVRSHAQERKKRRGRS